MIDLERELIGLRAEVTDLRARVLALAAELARLAGPRVLPDGTMRRRDVAQLLGVSQATVESWAKRGIGPPFRRVGGRAYYRADDVRTWAERRARAAPALPSREHAPLPLLHVT